MSVDINQERINAEKDPNEFDDAAAQLKGDQNTNATTISNQKVNNYLKCFQLF